jgi:hypothetical protein
MSVDGILISRESDSRLGADDCGTEPVIGTAMSGSRLHAG